MAGVVEHVQAVKTLLQAVSGTPSYAKVLESQVRAISNVIDASALSVADAALIAEALKAFPEAEKTALTAKVAERIAAPHAALKGSSTRASLQDFGHLMQYLTEEQWQALQDEQQPTHLKLEVLLMACVRLGLKCPTEASVQLMTALHLLMTEGAAKTAAMQPGVKLEMARSIKSKLKSMQHRLQESLPQEYVQRLPPTPAEFRDAYPAWWNLAFSTLQPGKPRIKDHELHAAMAGIPMRASRADASAKFSSSSSSGSPADPSNMMQHVMLAFMKNLYPNGMPGVHMQVEQRPATEIRFLRRLESKLAIADAHDESGSQASREVEAPVAMPVLLPTPQPVHFEPVPQQETPSAKKQKLMSAMDATAAVAAALSAKKDARKPEEATKPKATPKGKAKAKVKANAKQSKPAPMKAATSSHGTKPTWSYEWSRSQILCRTGLTGKGQTYTIRGTGPASVKAAKEWVKKHS